MITVIPSGLVFVFYAFGNAHLRAWQSKPSALHPYLIQRQLDLPCCTGDEVLYVTRSQATAIGEQPNVLLQGPDWVVGIRRCPASIPSRYSRVVAPVNPASKPTLDDQKTSGRLTSDFHKLCRIARCLRA